MDSMEVDNMVFKIIFLTVWLEKRSQNWVQLNKKKDYSSKPVNQVKPGYLAKLAN
jgi:hypothetical protein